MKIRQGWMAGVYAAGLGLFGIVDVTQAVRALATRMCGWCPVFNARNVP